MSTDLTSLAKQLSALTGEQALDLLSSIEGLTAKAAAHKAAVTSAEAQRDAWLPRLACTCGEAAKVATYVRWEIAHIRPGIATWRSTGATGGVVGSDADYGNSPTDDEDVKRISGDLWVSCGKRECAPAHVPGGYAAIVDWE